MDGRPSATDGASDIALGAANAGGYDFFLSPRGFGGAFAFSVDAFSAAVFSRIGIESRRCFGLCPLIVAS